MPLSTKQTIILGTGAAAIIGLFFVRKQILASIASAQQPPPTPPNIMLPGMGRLGEDTAFDKVANTTNKAITTLTGAIALTMGYFTLKEKKAAVSKAGAPAPAAPAAPAPAPAPATVRTRRTSKTRRTAKKRRR